MYCKFSMGDFVVKWKENSIINFSEMQVSRRKSYKLFIDRELILIKHLGYPQLQGLLLEGLGQVNELTKTKRFHYS